MRIVILGSKGMLGTALTQACREAGIEALGLDRDEVDVAQRSDLAAKIPRADWVVNCAGYTNVDGAEADRASAAAINGTGAANAADVCAATGAALLHVSTDYVFDGTLQRPYREDDPPNPLNHYGVTKLAGESAVRASSARWLILRTQSLFGANGRNFVQSILGRLDAATDPMKVVNDQVSAPTYTPFLAEGMISLIRCGHLGLVHLSASGSCSWYEFACAIARRVGAEGRILPIRAAEYPAAARRPANSVLDKALYTRWTGRVPPRWEQGLERYLAEIGRG